MRWAVEVHASGNERLLVEAFLALGLQLERMNGTVLLKGDPFEACDSASDVRELALQLADTLNRIGGRLCT